MRAKLLTSCIFVAACICLLEAHTLRKRSTRTEYTAAVYEHVPAEWTTGRLPADVVAANLHVFAEQVAAAASQDADIIVFPEYGVSGLGVSRQNLRQMAEEVPDPSEISVNFCQENPTKSSDVVIQTTLSCLAAQYNIYIVVNMPSWEPCHPTTDPNCRADGFYLYNTNIAFDAAGNLVGRYRKWTLYYEFNIDQPPTVEYDYFDTPFGRFGTFVCFDILFEKPAIDLVEEFNVDSIAFSTAWQSKFPLMQGVGFHESWSILTGVNLLSSELRVPERQFAGSGINAGSGGAVSYYFDLDTSSPGKLLVANLPTRPTRPNADVIPSLPELEEDFDVFTSLMRGDLFSFVALVWESHEVSITQENTTCYLNYQFQELPTEELYAFAVFQGMHHSAHNSYLQVCALVKCGNINDYDSCGDPVMTSTAIFESFTIKGQFSTDYVFPSVVLDGGFPTGHKNGWDFTLDPTNHRSSLSFGGLDKSIVYSTLYGRIFDRDTEENFADGIGSKENVGAILKPLTHIWLMLAGAFYHVIIMSV